MLQVIFLELIKLKKIGKDFIQLTGEDNNALNLINGGSGCISVTANVAAKLCSDFQKYSLKNSPEDQKKAKILMKYYHPCTRLYFWRATFSCKICSIIIKVISRRCKIALVKEGRD